MDADLLSEEWFGEELRMSEQLSSTLKLILGAICVYMDLTNDIISKINQNQLGVQR